MSRAVKGLGDSILVAYHLAEMVVAAPHELSAAFHVPEVFRAQTIPSMVVPILGTFVLILGRPDVRLWLSLEANAFRAHTADCVPPDMGAPAANAPLLLRPLQGWNASHFLNFASTFRWDAALDSCWAIFASCVATMNATASSRVSK